MCQVSVGQDYSKAQQFVNGIHKLLVKYDEATYGLYYLIVDMAEIAQPLLDKDSSSEF